MEFKLKMPLITFLLYFISLFIVLIVYLLFDSKKHIPKSGLSEQQETDIIKYGLLHFTTFENLQSIINDCYTIRCFPKRALYHKEKYMTWFFPINNDLNDEIISTYYKKIISKRKNVNVCINLINISESEIEHFLFQEHDGYLVHIGDIRADMVVYILNDDKWEKQL